MPDDATSSSASAPQPAGSSTGTPPGGDDGAGAWLADLERQAGLDEPATAPPSAAPPTGGRPAAPPAAPAAAAPPAARRPSAEDVNARAKSRRESRRLAAHEGMRTLQEENRALRGVIAEALQGEEPPPAAAGTRPAAADAMAARRARPAAETVAADPEPVFLENPQEWHRWNGRERSREIAAAVEPLVAAENERRRAELAQREQEEQQRQARERNDDFLQAERDYSETEEGQGWSDRLNMFTDAVEFAVGEYFPTAPPALARAIIQGQAELAAVIADREGLNPAYVLDRLFDLNSFLGTAVGALRPSAAGSGQRTTGAAAVAPATRPPPGWRPTRQTPAAAANAEIAGMRAAAAAPEAHTLGAGSSTSTTSADDIGGLASSGRLNAERLRAGLERQGVKGRALLQGVFDTMSDLERRRSGGGG